MVVVMRRVHHRGRSSSLYVRCSASEEGKQRHTSGLKPPAAAASASAAAPVPERQNAKELGSLEVMRKFSEQYAKRSNTSFCIDKVGAGGCWIKRCVNREKEKDSRSSSCAYHIDSTPSLYTHTHTERERE